MLHWLDAQRPVAFFANGIGDTFLNLPALRALSALFPGKLTLICDPIAYRLCLSELSLKEILEVGPWEEDGDRRLDTVRLAAAVGECDLFISLVPWYPDALQCFLEYLAPRTSVGFFPQFDIALPRDYRKHTSDLAFDIPKFFDPSLLLDDYSAPPKFQPDVENEAERIYAHVPSGFRVLALHVDTKIEKMWPLDRFISVLDLFLGSHSEFFVFAVGGVRQPLDAGRAGAHVLPAYGLSLAVSCCLVSQADLFLGVDSCMLHVADLGRVPGVGLFGPTSSHEFGFRFGRHRHVSGSEKMEDVSVSAVFQAMESLLKEIEENSATGKDLGSAPT